MLTCWEGYAYRCNHGSLAITVTKTFWLKFWPIDLMEPCLDLYSGPKPTLWYITAHEVAYCCHFGHTVQLLPECVHVHRLVLLFLFVRKTTFAWGSVTV